MFIKKRLAEVTAFVLAVTSAVPSGIPAAAKTSRSGISAEKDNITYTFFSSDFTPYADSVSLSDLAGAEEDRILQAAGEDAASVYAAHADFFDADGDPVPADSSVFVSVSQESGTDNRNVRLFALDDNNLSSCMDNLGDYEIGMENKDGFQYWDAGTDTDYIILVENTESVSAETGDFLVTADRVQQGAVLSVTENTTDKTSAAAGTLVLKNSRFVPSSLEIGLPSDIQNNGDFILKLQGNGAQVSLSGGTGNPVRFRLSEDAMRLIESTKDREGNYSVRFSLSAENESQYAKVQNSGIKVQAVNADSVILRENGTTQKSARLGDNEYAYIDKYITKIDGKEVNGQATYTTTIEQAVSSDTVIPAMAPKKQDIVMVLDSSASMGDKVDATNNAVSTFLTRIMQVNKERKAKWDKGEYDDTDGDTVENHLLSINAVIKYNNKVTVLNSSRITPMTQADADRIANAAKLRNGYEPNGSLYDMTRTDLALSKAREYISDPANTSVVLMTDGEPYGRGDEGALDYDTDTYSGLMMTYENTNSALQTARSIKNGGSSIYAIYVQSGYPAGLIDNAKASGNISDLATTPSQTGGNRVLSDQSLGCAFLSLVSSDYPQNGLMHGDSDGSGDHKFTGSYDNPGSGVFGRYFKMPEEIKKMVDSFADVANDINDKTSYSYGYAGPSSYIYDVVSYPFHADTSTSAIRVYQVPRICYGEENGQKLFRWGSEEDITDKVTASIENGRYITVQGYNYERNAVSSFNKRLKAGEEELLPSASGDYGYKIVVRFNIYANRIFGGNGIETNDSAVSGFYPSVPNQKESWEKNKALNPDENRYIDLYPVPKVDLNIDYKVVSDNVVIFAPQTAELDNLATDASNSLFATDPAYPALKNEYDFAKEKVDETYSGYTQAAKDYQASVGTDGEEEALNTLQEKQLAYSNAQSNFATAQKNFDTAQNYIPDGDNNAYVNIHYSMTGPDGAELGTMDIPHGTAYDGSNLHWTWSQLAHDPEGSELAAGPGSTSVAPESSPSFG